MLARPHPLVPPKPARPHPLVPPLLLRTRMMLLVLVEGDAMAAVRGPPPLIPPLLTRVSMLP
jgi:hypothetical protein